MLLIRCEVIVPSSAKEPQYSAEPSPFARSSSISFIAFSASIEPTKAMVEILLASKYSCAVCSLRASMFCASVLNRFGFLFSSCYQPAGGLVKVENVSILHLPPLQIVTNMS